MDFSGFKTKSIKLIDDGRESDARTALGLFGLNLVEIDTFIEEVKADAQAQADFEEQTRFFKGILTDIDIALPEIDGDTINALKRLTKDWSKMPSIAISLSRSVVTNDAGVEIVTFSWNKISKFSGAGASKPTATESNGDRIKSVDPPPPYKTWQEVCQAILPSAVKDVIAKRGSTKGFNARIPVRDAIRKGEITLTGWTEEMNY